MKNPLHNIRVLDLTRLLPGAVCTLMLAGMGAEVVKVEDPNGGDYARWMPPLIADGQAAFFHATNRGKRSIIVNLKDERGQAVLRRLVEGADVLIEGFRPGVLDRLNCGYAALRTVNPRLIYCALSGWGQDSAYVARSGHDLNYLAVAGLLANDQPQPYAGQVADVGGAYVAVSAILAALFGRERGGIGAFLDVSLFASALPFGYAAWVETMAAGDSWRPGMLTGAYACYNVYTAQDGRRVTLSALEPKFWANFANAVERPDFLAGDYMAADRQEALRAALRELFATRSAASWQTILEPADCCFALVNTFEQVADDPQIRASGMMRPNPDGAPFVGSPLPFPNATEGSSAPDYGAHTRQVLTEVGYNQAEIDDLCAAGVIKQKVADG